MTPGTASNRERRRRERKLWRAAMGFSIGVHLFLFLFWRVPSPPVSPYSAAGPEAGDNRAASGSMQALRLATAPPRPIIPPRVPTPVPMDVDPVELEEAVEIDFSSLLGERPGEGEGPGIEEGEGRGDGGTAAEGRSRIIPPSPRSMILPPSNRNLRDREVEVWVYVLETGRVAADSVRLMPPTSDRDFNRRLIQEATRWMFEPARRGGTPVAAWFRYVISMEWRGRPSE